MSSDIVLNDGETRDWVTIDGAVLAHRGSDLMVDAAARRKSTGGFRRALVHTQDDGLALNFNGDYPGGVTISDLRRLNLRPVPVLGKFKLPRTGTPGEIIMVYYMAKVYMPPMVVTEVQTVDGVERGSETLDFTPASVLYGPDSPELATAAYVVSGPDEIDPHVLIPDAPVADGSHTLWICVGTDEDDRALWSQVPLGDPVRGE
jgi:hypothetical protein